MVNDLTIYTLDTVPIIINVTDSAGDAVDVTGYEFFFTAKTNKSDADASAVIKKDTDTPNDPTNGQAVITLSTTDTNVTAGKYFYDIQMKDGSGQITTLVYGDLIIRTGITIRSTAE